MMITVVAALIQHDGKLLICQRRYDAAFPLKWEFPGGKVQPNESPEQALVRELREELGVAAAVDREVFRARHRYAELHDELCLIFFAVHLEDRAALQNLAFETMEWAAVDRLPAFDFLPADRELIAKLAAGEIKMDT